MFSHKCDYCNHEFDLVDREEKIRSLFIQVVGIEAICHYCIHRDEPEDKTGAACYYHCTSGSRSAFEARTDLNVRRMIQVK